MVEKIFVREYLESLKEDGELDKIFTILLEVMDFQVVANPKASKGQSQYGKDVVAVGKAENGVKYRWYFEVKGYADRDVNQTTFTKKDGIRESLYESIDAPYIHKGLPNFEKLPIKHILVHNGVVKENFKHQFNGFIGKHFKDNEFEDWDIFKLTDLFYKYLFGEYLLTEPETAKLFKRILIFLDVPDYDFDDLKKLLAEIINQYKQKPNPRKLKKLFSTINLIALIIWHYCRASGNLYPAKYAISYLVLNTWAFILSEKSENKPSYQTEFLKVLRTQFNFYVEYFNKTLSFACYPNGLFSNEGFSFEPIGYPLRAFEYIDDFMYFCLLSDLFVDGGFQSNPRYIREQKELIKQIVLKNEDGLCRPILDNHLIPILHLFFFFTYQNPKFLQEDYNFLAKYLIECFTQIHYRLLSKDTMPYCNQQLEPLIEFEATGVKPFNYSDKSSLLLPILFELTALLKLEDIYYNFREIFYEKVNMQIAYPHFNAISDFEVRFFSKHLDNEYWVDCGIKLPEDFEEFRKEIMSTPLDNHKFKTEEQKLGLLKFLAQSFYKNEPFPEEWRGLFRIFDFNISGK